MNILLTILLVVLSLLVLLLIVALFLKKGYEINRSIIIDIPQSEVFKFIKLLKEQKRYNVWVMKDPNVKMDYVGTDGTVGAINTWEGNKDAGKGEQEIIALTENSVTIELRFEKPLKNVGLTIMSAIAVDTNQTHVTWIMSGKVPYPMNLMTAVMSNMLGSDMSRSLMNLKSSLENKSK